MGLLKSKKFQEYRAKYLKSSGVKCPFCDSMNISAGHLEGDAGTAWSDVECRDCKKNGEKPMN